ncbi:MOSC domain-containing protein [Acanthopleuribacter pedis]|uniref:MOSC domain-containing protein n=1 Tax=Acanthopleuribacter pedis TaxID=442870 RepID=A0A8J7QKY0_9BACT|nr:MOSC N-terminal beta barrel domain-containing protein [Acanthopleuribacter pedis]MBO1319870.1 MOSC domain-containing protein [Acanthopleuribacter pedis]
MLLRELWVYPLKSAAGIAVSEMTLAPRGPLFDRRWMMVDPEGKFLTARKLHRLLLLKTEIRGDSLVLSGPGMAPLVVPTADGRERIPVTIWKDTVDAALVGGEADAWLSAFLGTAGRLVVMDEQARRCMTHDAGFEQDEVSFADGMPVMVANENSLLDLNARAGENFSMQRFRPNLVIDGAEPFAEEGWSGLRIGAVTFKAVKPCRRCVLTTIDPFTAEPHPRGEPMRTLSGYRKKEDGVYFGLNLTATNNGVIRRGDPVTVL